MARTSNSLDSSEGSHFSGRPPPPYHLFDVTKQFSFSYATTVGPGTESEDVDEAFSEREQDSELIVEWPDTLSRAFHAISIKERVAALEEIAAPPLPVASPSGDSNASTPVLAPLIPIAADQDSAFSMFSSEDGGVLLPRSSASGSKATLQPELIPGHYLDTLRERSIQPPRQLGTTAVFRSATLSAPVRTRIEASLIARNLSAATDHQQYASYRRQYDRYRSMLAKTLLSIPSDVNLDSLNIFDLRTRECDKCAEPWALSSICSWLKDLLGIQTKLEANDILNVLMVLFMHKAEQINTRVDAPSLSHRVFKEMLAAGTLVNDKGNIQFGPLITTGVLLELTGQGCYSPREHAMQTSYSCYSFLCVSKRNLIKSILS